MCRWLAMTNAQSCVRLLNGKHDLSKLFCPSYNLFRIEPRVSNPLFLLTILMVFGRTSGAIDFAVILLRRVSREQAHLLYRVLHKDKWPTSTLVWFHRRQIPPPVGSTNSGFKKGTKGGFGCYWCDTETHRKATTATIGTFDGANGNYRRCGLRIIPAVN